MNPPASTHALHSHPHTNTHILLHLTGGGPSGTAGAILFFLGSAVFFLSFWDGILEGGSSLI